MKHEQNAKWITCPTDSLSDYVNHGLVEEERSAVAAHLEDCPQCRAEVQVLKELQLALQRASADVPVVRTDLFEQIETQITADTLVQPVRPITSGLRRWLGSPGEHIAFQTRLIHRHHFWMPLLLMPLVVWMLALHQAEYDVPDTIVLFVILVLALGKAFLFGRDADPPYELLMTTPTSPRLILTVRCGLVFGYDLLINCGVVLPLLAWQGLVTPGWFLQSWLAPLICLGAIALLVGTISSPVKAVFVCVVLWCLRLPIDTVLFDLHWHRFYEALWQHVPLLLLVSVCAFILTFSLSGGKEPRYEQSYS